MSHPKNHFNSIAESIQAFVDFNISTFQPILYAAFANVAESAVQAANTDVWSLARIPYETDIHAATYNSLLATGHVTV